jgi:cytidylate kinase
MWKNIGLEHALSFINCQLRSPGGPFAHQGRPAITISRMTGSGGRSVAAGLAEYLQEKAASHCPWTVFDRNLVEKVLEEHQLPKRVGQYMTENHRSLLADTIEELLGLHPSSWTLVQQTTETIWHLGQMGYVIIVGRGANLITSRLPTVFHVRLVGSFGKRAKRVEEVFQLGATAALEFIKKEDGGRQRYLKEHFGKDIDDPLLYHMILNTDQVRYDDAAVLIGQAAMERFPLAFKS